MLHGGLTRTRRVGAGQHIAVLLNDSDNFLKISGFSDEVAVQVHTLTVYVNNAGRPCLNVQDTGLPISHAD